MSVLVTVCVVIGTFGACTGFLVIIGDLLTPIVGKYEREKGKKRRRRRRRERKEGEKKGGGCKVGYRKG